MDWLKQRHPEWKNLTRMVAMDRQRFIGEATTREARYLIRQVASRNPKLQLKCFSPSIFNFLGVKLKALFFLCSTNLQTVLKNHVLDSSRIRHFRWFWSPSFSRG
jgi:hypothetical protein